MYLYVYLIYVFCKPIYQFKIHLALCFLQTWIYFDFVLVAGCHQGVETADISFAICALSPQKESGTPLPVISSKVYCKVYQFSQPKVNHTRI